MTGEALGRPIGVGQLFHVLWLRVSPLGLYVPLCLLSSLPPTLPPPIYRCGTNFIRVKATPTCVLRSPTTNFGVGSSCTTSIQNRGGLPDTPLSHLSEENLVHPRVTQFYPHTTHELWCLCITQVLLDLLMQGFDLSYPYRRLITVLIPVLLY